MRLANGDLWTMEGDAICITTNGSVTNRGNAVMGRGCALQAAQKFPWLPTMPAAELTDGGNHVRHFTTPQAGLPSLVLIMFPVKDRWDQKARLKLIEQSAYELMDLIERLKLQNVLLPRPGCGNGGRTWAEVEPILSPVLDDRVIVVDF